MLKISYLLRIFVLALASVLFAAFLVPALPAGAAGAEEGQEPGGEIGLFMDQPVLFNQWSYEDYLHLQEIYNNYTGDPEKARSLVYAEWQAIASLMTRIAVTEAYFDQEREYVIYPAKPSGKLHVLGAARAAREAFLELAGKGVLKETDFKEIYPDIRRGSMSEVEGNMGTVEYLPAGEDRYVPLETAVKVLNGLSLPEKALKGYTLFLMPYEFRGLGGFAYSRLLPQVEEASFISAVHSVNGQGAESAIAHEAGHFMHYRYIGNYSSQDKRWRQYLELRGKTWRQGSWADSTAENFAEDFRVSCGGEDAARPPHAGAYGPPGPALKSALAKYFQELAAEPDVIPAEYGKLYFHPAPDVTALPVNGMENTNTVLAGGRRLEVRGTFNLNMPEYEAVIFTKGDACEVYQPLKMLPEGVFAQEVTLPGAGVYDLVAGVMKDKTIVTYQLVKVYSYDFSLDLSEKDKLDDRLISPQQPATAAFSDMAGNWAAGYVGRLAGMGLISGYPDGTFGPDNQITRAEFLALLVKSLRSGAAGSQTGQYLLDVPEEHWAYNLVNSALSTGMIDAGECPGGWFRPDDPVTRGEMVAFIEGFFKVKYPYLALQSPLAMGIFNGYPDGGYGLERASTRAEAAVILARLAGVD
ncbi:MAG: Cellulosome-anchoring protein precursor [Pelotomaculum sp. PtaU1.Bin035]|nr:MAG: Cellulosome-anchoring protein precursor [Pelotomaculum sp. PtaU1.Bin035]